MKNKKIITTLIILLIGSFIAYYEMKDNKLETTNNETTTYTYNIENIPDYNGEDYIILNNNIPNFDLNDIDKEPFEEYSNLDNLKRCGVAYANLSIELMPTEERESIASIKPSGWHTIKYDNIDGKYLYNRCHLIGYQLTGENKNEKNLITCTRNMNAKTMLKFENKVSEYIKRTKNKVLYRVTPIFNDDNLVAEGVIIEAYSKDKEIEFNVFIYNVQDGIYINYQNGDSHKIK